MNNIILGNCIDVLKTLEENSIDSIVTDPPYGLAFMGKSWDSFKTNKEYREFSESWAKEAYRVLKPGGYLLAFSGTRTYHHMAVGIEDAGFKCKDMIQWVYGSGFPKSMNISKSIDKSKGLERKVTGVKPGHENFEGRNSVASLNKGGALAEQGFSRPWMNDPEKVNKYHMQTEANSKEAKEWEGYGTALKPANEPIMVAQKPISEGTIAANCLKWGVGALNIDGCRVLYDETNKPIPQIANNKRDVYNKKTMFDGQSALKSETKAVIGSSTVGRWPANFIHNGSKEVIDLFPNTKSGAMKHEVQAYGGESNTKMLRGKSGPSNQHGDSGSAARFFYCAKTSTKERHAGLEDKNDHPTLKPIELMKYLVRLVTPHNGTVLDPFMGSGSTGIACIQEGKEFIGIEMSEDYFKIAQNRIKHHDGYHGYRRAGDRTGAAGKGG